MTAEAEPTSRPRRQAIAWWLALAAIAVAGLVARCWGLDYDQRQHQHPDERFWTIVADQLGQADDESPPEPHGTVAGPVLDWLDADTSPANPYRVTESFVYGPFPLALSRGVAGWLRDGVDRGDEPAATIVGAVDALGVPLLNDDGTARFDDRYQVDLVGRLLSALTDTATIVLVGLIGRRFGRLAGFGAAVGLLAAGFYAACPLVIQQAHVMSSEPLLAFTVALTVLAAVGIDRSRAVRRARWHGALAGAAGGAVVATKLSGIGVLLVPAAGCALLLWRHRRPADVVRLAALALGAAAAFRVLHPAAFDGLGVGLSDAFRADITRLRHQYDADTPPSIQWAGRSGVGGLAPGVAWLFRFTFGPGLCLAAIAGVAASAVRWRQGRAPGGRWPIAIVVAFALVPAAVVFATALPSGRYFVPSLPATCALAGTGVVALWRRAHRFDVRWATMARAGAAALVGVNVLWGVMFVRGVYATSYTRTAASEWIAANVAPGSVLTSEAWDDGLPMWVPGVDPTQYEYEQLQLVGTDSVDKVVGLVRQLQRADYVVESSPRLWGTIGRIPARFPSTQRFFDRLDSGVLGFERVATFDRQPQLGPLRLDDSGAEEVYSVFDHPEVRIWRKTRDIGTARMLDALDPVAAARAVTVTATGARSGGLLLTDGEAADLASGPTWEQSFAGGPGWLHALAWLVALEALAAAAFVLALPLLGRLPDAGWGVAKPLGLLGPAVLLFVGNSWFGITVARATAALAVAVFLAAGSLAAWRRRALVGSVARRVGRVAVAVEAATLVTFAGALALRAANPDLWHPSRSGEKPFELALLSAVLRTDNFPPYDPWFSGGVLNYYYGGYLMLTAPARLIGTAPAVVMNVGVAVFAACMAAAAAGAGALLAERRGGRRGPGPVVGALAGTFVVVGANVAVARAAWRHWRSGAPFDWWSVSRVVPGTTDITEFPAWSLLFADLHPHVMAAGLVLTMLVIAVALYRATRRGPGRHAVALAAIAGVVAGALRAVNTWDFPLATGVAVAALGLAATAPAARRRAAVAAATLAAALVVPWRPYVTRGEVADQGVQIALTHTPFVSWLLQFGLFAAVTVVAVGPTAWRATRCSPRIGRWGIRAGVVRGVGFALVGIGCLLVWRWSGAAVAATVLATAAGWAAGRWSADPGRALAALALATGWVIQVGVELVTIVNDIGRQNTVFKFWFESWLLLGIGAAALVLRLVTSRGPARHVGRLLAAGGVTLAALFWGLAVPARVADRVSGGGWSLDGERYLTDPTEAASAGYREQTFQPADDLALAAWLRANVRGAPVLAEAAGDDYAWTSRMTWLTGLPTPAGWRFHEIQQRRATNDAVERRHVDLALLYTTTDEAELARILATYEVRYLVFGTVERALATPASAQALRTFDCLEVVFESGDGYVATVDGDCARDVWLAALVAEVSRPEPVQPG